VGVNYHITDDGSSKQEIIGPEEESVLAFATTIRLFIQKDEPISFQSISKIISTDKDISADWKKNYFEVSKHLNTYLNESPLITEPPKKTPTRREIINVFINGDIFHVKDEEKRNIFEGWSNSPIEFLYVNEFHLTLDHVAQIILLVADLAKTALSQNP
jgi:hypothetical protein